MNLRDHYPALIIAGLALAIAILVGGAIAIGLVSVSDFTGDSPGEQNNTSTVTPPSEDALPAGYQPNGIASTKAFSVHQSALADTAYTYEYSKWTSQQSTNGESVSLDVDKAGGVVGTQTTHTHEGNDVTYNLSSEDGQLYIVSRDGTTVREFGDSNYAKGGDVLRQVFEYENFTLDDYEEYSDGYLYHYSFEASNHSVAGGLIVTDTGRIHRAYLTSMQDGEEVNMEFTIRVREE